MHTWNTKVSENIFLIWIKLTEINCKNIMTEIDPIVGIKDETTMKMTMVMNTIDCKYSMKEVGPITVMVGTEMIGMTCEIIAK